MASTPAPIPDSAPRQGSLVARLSGLAYAGLAYLLFLGSFTAFAAVVHGIPMPWAVDFGLPSALAVALNVGLVLSFAVQHTIMARAGFKRWWTRFVPAHLERSTFVLFSSLLMLAIVSCWQVAPGGVWAVESSILTNALHGGFVLGYLGVVASSFLIDHFHLFGLQQAWRHFRSRTPKAPVFREPWAYRQIRHPMMIAVIVMMWSTPTMSFGQALLAALFTAYALIGVLFEERELVAEHGDAYREYQQRVPKRVIPWLY
jgi:protein-S-isoprenylcysteine O-methyltransferase Ste14